MISFECDYINGTHPAILDALVRTNNDVLSGYGNDKYTVSAKKRIGEACGGGVDVEFLSGGTQTNAIVIATMLNDYEGVVSARSGHINVHEAGAIEFGGHKVLAIDQKDGKIDAKTLRDYLVSFYADPSHEHTVFPGMVYLSHPTEYGTIYTRSELTAISEVCREYSIPLYLDGARLGYGLESRQSDMTLKDIASICDVFYIGGTKVGTLCGEAVVFTKNNKPRHFNTSVKKRGAMLAKGRLIGVQFDTLFQNDLYFEISKNAIEMAEKLKNIFKSRNIPFFIDSPTNQQFVIMENKAIEELKSKVGFEYWEKYDETHSVVRFATSWSTAQSDIDYLDSLI